VSAGREGAEDTLLRPSKALPWARLVVSESKGFSNFLLKEQPLDALLSPGSGY
jgi:hypothetical protein